MALIAEGISWTTVFIGEVWRRRPVYTFEHKYCEFKVKPCLLPSASEVDGGAT